MNLYKKILLGLILLGALPASSFALDYEFKQIPVAEQCEVDITCKDGVCTQKQECAVLKVNDNDQFKKGVNTFTCEGVAAKGQKVFAKNLNDTSAEIVEVSENGFKLEEGDYYQFYCAYEKDTFNEECDNNERKVTCPVGSDTCTDKALCSKFEGSMNKGKTNTFTCEGNKLTKHIFMKVLKNGASVKTADTGEIEFDIDENSRDKYEVQCYTGDESQSTADLMELGEECKAEEDYSNDTFCTKVEIEEQENTVTCKGGGEYAKLMVSSFEKGKGIDYEIDGPIQVRKATDGVATFPVTKKQNRAYKYECFFSNNKVAAEKGATSENCKYPKTPLEPCIPSKDGVKITISLEDDENCKKENGKYFCYKSDTYKCKVTAGLQCDENGNKVSKENIVIPDSVYINGRKTGITIDRSADKWVGDVNESCTLENTCGDGIKDEGEECDGGTNCTDQCRLKNTGIICGNGQKDVGEQCDPTDITKKGWGKNGCSSLCLHVVPHPCPEGNTNCITTIPAGQGWKIKGEKLYANLQDKYTYTFDFESSDLGAGSTNLVLQNLEKIERYCPDDDANFECSSDNAQGKLYIKEGQLKLKEDKINKQMTIQSAYPGFFENRFKLTYKQWDKKGRQTSNTGEIVVTGFDMGEFLKPISIDQVLIKGEDNKYGTGGKLSGENKYRITLTGTGDTYIKNELSVTALNLVDAFIPDDVLAFSGITNNPQIDKDNAIVSKVDNGFQLTANLAYADENNLVGGAVDIKDLKIKYNLGGYQDISYTLSGAYIGSCEKTKGLKVTGTAQGEGRIKASTGGDETFTNVSLTDARTAIRSKAYELIRGRDGTSLTVVNGVGYIKDDYSITDATLKELEEVETLIVEEGVLKIETNIKKDHKLKGIIVLSSDKQIAIREINGDVIVGDDVTNIHAVIYAEGGFKHDGSPSTKQLDLYGTLFTNNTVGGGADDFVGFDDKYILPGGTKKKGEKELAKRYDLNDIREIQCGAEYAFKITYNSDIQQNPPKGFSQ